MAGKKYVVVGCGWIGLRAVRALEANCPTAEITVLEMGAKDYIDMNMTTPRAIVDPEFAEKVYQPLSKAWTGAKLVHVSGVTSVSSGSVVYTDAAGADHTLEADGIVIATGMVQSSPLIKDVTGMSKADRMAQCKAFGDAVKNSKAGVLVCGGGTTGVEVAGEIGDIKGVKCTLINKPDLLLKGSAKQAKMHKMVKKQLERAGVTVMLGDYIEGLREDYVGEPKTFKTHGGKEVTADVVVICVGGHPNLPFAPAEAKKDGKGGLLVDNAFLSTKIGTDPAKPVWALGDCTVYGGRGSAADVHISAFVASVKNFEATGTTKGGPEKYKHKENSSFPALVSVGHNGGAMSMPFPNKVMGKALKGKDLALAFMYKKEFKVAV